MRLIDADELKNKLDTISPLYATDEYDYCTKDILDKVYDLIQKQPTAYDVDKVVEQLNELASCEESRAAEYDEAGKIDRMNIHDGKAAAYKNTIRVIKSGGIE